MIVEQCSSTVSVVCTWAAALNAQAGETDWKSNARQQEIYTWIDLQRFIYLASDKKSWNLLTEIDTKQEKLRLGNHSAPVVWRDVLKIFEWCMSYFL